MTFVLSEQRSRMYKGDKPQVKFNFNFLFIIKIKI